MTPLRSIPPAHRSSKIPSKIPVTGLPGHSARTRPRSNLRRLRPFHPNVTPTNDAQLARRTALNTALVANRHFWKEELTMWQEEFGDDYVAKLKQRLGIGV